MTAPIDLRQATRFNVVGTSGSGKSTFSRRLAAILDAPYIELDRLFWRPQWQQTPDDEFLPAVAAALTGPRWVLDGNYTHTIPIKWAKVEIVIWLDYPLVVTMIQAISRAVRRSWHRNELWPGTGNRESFRKSFFSRDSIIWWTIRTFARTRRNYESLMANPDFAHIRFLRITSRAEAEALLHSIASR